MEKQRHYFANKGPSGQSYGFSSSHVWVWELDHKEGWVQNNWCFWTELLEKTLEGPLDCTEVKPVHPKGNEPWIFMRNWYWSWSSNALDTWCEEVTHWKRPWCWERLKVGGEVDDRRQDGWMASQSQWAWDERTLRDSEGQGSLAGSGLWDHKESDTTQRLNNSTSYSWSFSSKSVLEL